MSQSYLAMLETGQRRVTPSLARKFKAVYGLSPTALPTPDLFSPRVDVRGEEFVSMVSALGYPGFAYMRSWVSKKNPAEVLLMALGQDRLEARVAEALPWVVMQFGHRTSNWLVEQARKFNLQNRLGFVVSLALQVAERAPGHDNTRVQSLRELRSKLDESRLVKEDVFYRPPQTEGEKQWLVRNRSQEAMHWNLLTDLKPEQLQYAD